MLRRRGWVPVIVAIVAAAALAGPLAVEARASAPTSAPPGTSVVTDLSWTGPTRGWAVGTSSLCADPESAFAAQKVVCVEQLFSTADRGRRWTAVGSTDGVVGIRFANRTVGYSFGARNSTDDSGSGFAMTTNGGRNWTRQPGRPVAALEVVGRRVVRVTYSHTGCPGPCDWRISTSSVGSTRWHPARFPQPRFNDSVQLVHGGTTDVYAAFFGHTAGGAPDQTTDLVVSHDAGRTWTARGDPCAGDPKRETDTVSVAAAPGGIVASLCYPRGATTGGYVRISQDGSRTYGRAGLIPDRFLTTSIAIASSRDVLLSNPFDLAGGGPRLFASHDGGRSWKTVITEAPAGATRATPGDWELLGFSGPSSGYWIGGGQTLWTTADRGRTWTMNPTPGG